MLASYVQKDKHVDIFTINTAVVLDTQICLQRQSYIQTLTGITNTHRQKSTHTFTAQSF